MPRVAWNAPGTMPSRSSSRKSRRSTNTTVGEKQHHARRHRRESRNNFVGGMLWNIDGVRPGANVTRGGCRSNAEGRTLSHGGSFDVAGPPTTGWGRYVAPGKWGAQYALGGMTKPRHRTSSSRRSSPTAESVAHVCGRSEPPALLAPSPAPSPSVKCARQCGRSVGC